MLKRRTASPAGTDRENECSWEKVGWRVAYLNLGLDSVTGEGDKGEVGREREGEAKDGIIPNSSSILH